MILQLYDSSQVLSSQGRGGGKRGMVEKGRGRGKGRRREGGREGGERGKERRRKEKGKEGLRAHSFSSHHCVYVYFWYHCDRQIIVLH